MDVEKHYQDAVAKLNGLQSNAKTIAEMREKRQEMAALNMKETHFYMNALGITDDKLDLLRAVHVSGTKGKGTTCAYVESILRHHGLRTGFYSSPHLVHVRERIRIDGKSISKEKFATRFFEVYEIVEQTSKLHNVVMPAYFKFLTLMAFYTYLKEEVDVAIIEVGIGGEYDSTNVLRSPVVTGITTLDIDHTSILGSTIPEIAWHKAGIMKPKIPCFTVPQSSEAWKVFEKRAAERSTSIRECVDFDEYQWSSDVQKYVEEHGQHHKFNIALAVELAKTWLRNQKHCDGLNEMNGSGDHTRVNKIVEEAILETKWMGRSQVLKNGNITYHLDGAHTPKSIQYCADWFSYALEKRVDSFTGLRILIFHCTADRDPMTLLPILTSRIRFDLALFCPTRLVPVLDPRNDNTNLNQSEDEQWKKCLRARDTWKTLTNTDEAETYVCISDCVKRVHSLAENNAEVQVLVTGSLHLVGGVLNFEGNEIFGPKD
ncbi:Folylpolyglutamate synthase [Aphelenchoides besseyi]|nr:Folylpolyglutamate synthase [Aphelenchoides besseyi]KAI6232466.1 Folylpolyglutamate synthase [Aphelenchoides besseyi]